MVKILWLPLVTAIICLPVFAQTQTHAAAQALKKREHSLLSLAAVSKDNLASLEEVKADSTLTLAHALQLALRANPDLSASRHEAAAVNAEIDQAGLLPNPEVSWLMEDTQRDTRTTTVQFSQPIELGDKRAARISAASRSSDLADATLLAKQVALRADVTRAFFELLSAQQQSHLADESLALAEQVTSIAARRVAAGKVSPVEESRAQIAQANIRIEAVRAKSTLLNARKQLAALWGSTAPLFSKVSGQLETLPVVPEWNVLKTHLSAAPLMMQARSEVERRQAIGKVEDSRRTPDLSVTLGVKRDEQMGRNQAVVGVSIPLPLFDRNQGNLLAALRRTDQARDELISTEIRLDGELAQSYQRFLNAQSETHALKDEILPNAQSAYQAATKGFTFGKFAFLDVLDAQRSLLQARTQYLQSLLAAHRAAADIEELLGQPLDAISQKDPAL
tara:strand:- start:381328 stop:382677 length:1350 start_codon:yes stop_codon:yes gene_type:complete